MEPFVTGSLHFAGCFQGSCLLQPLVGPSFLQLNRLALHGRALSSVWWACGWWVFTLTFLFLRGACLWTHTADGTESPTEGRPPCPHRLLLPARLSVSSDYFLSLKGLCCSFFILTLFLYFFYGK